MNIPFLIAGICFVGVGLIGRKQKKKDWRALFLGGIAMLVIVIVVFIFGWRL
jgi:FtsH-binding integral membrane protein